MMLLRSLTAAVCVLAGALSLGQHVAPSSAEATSAVRPLPFFYDLYTFRDEAGSDGTTVVASIAIEARRLSRERVRGQSRYRFDVRFVLADTAIRSVSNTEDSVYLSLPAALSSRHLVHTYVEVKAPPSEATLQRVVVTDAARPGTGQLYSSAFPIPDYSGPELMLSDVAFGLPDATGGWARRGVTLALLPTSQFPSSAFDVYYEIYNLSAGTPYETELSIQSIDDDRNATSSPVRTLFTGESAARDDGSVSELRRIESALPRGRYRFTVRVRDQLEGRVATRSRDFEVREWGGGATLVHAMPYKGRRTVGESTDRRAPGRLPMTPYPRRGPYHASSCHSHHTSTAPDHRVPSAPIQLRAGSPMGAPGGAAGASGTGAGSAGRSRKRWMSSANLCA